MTTTGYTDTFGRTVSNGLGSATSGQAYTLFGVASQFSVAPNVASIAISSGGDKLGYVDLETQDVDISGQVAFSAIPATNLATAGFVAKLSGTSNYFNGTMMVAAGGAVSLRFSKVVAGSLVTISSTVVTGLTYVANTFYNLRYSIFWSRPLQTNVMSLKLWAVGTAQPGGWMATATDASFSQYTSGTSVGLVGRDESSVVGSVTTKYQNIAVNSYHLPMPALTDPMCYDPAVTYPKQTALQSLAAAADAAVVSLDPLASLAGLFPRVRVSNSNLVLTTSGNFASLPYNAVEFNIGTNTNLAYDNTSLILSVGVWLVTFEIELVEAASNFISLLMGGGAFSPTSAIQIQMRSNAVQSNDAGIGGCGHASIATYCTDPTTPLTFSVLYNANNPATTYTVKYMALSAIKVSDYFA